MKKVLTKKFYVTFAFAILALAGLNAQKLTPASSLYRHGTNSGSAGATVAPENTDSVTVSSAMDYFVMPDALYNPSYNPTVSLTANLVSSFTWSTAPAGPSVATKTGFGSNYVTVTWPGTAGSYTLNVKENAASGCDDATGRDISVTTIAKPTANFSAASSTQCTATPASQSFALPLNLTTDINNGRLTADFQVVYTPVAGAPTTTTYNNIALTESGTLNLETLIGASLAYGKYEVSISAVRDRISVKSNVTGTIGATPLYTYNLIRLPQTGEIYHVPNI